MPVAIIVVVLALGAIIGFTALQNGDESEPTATISEVRPAEEEADNEVEVETEAEADASASGPAPDVLNEEVDPFTSGMAEPTPEPLDTPVVGGVYADGSYTVETSYFTPSRTEHEMDVTLVVNDDIVTDASISYDGGTPSSGHHRRFDAAYRSEVIGQPLAGISLSRVGGASLTTEAFNEAVDTIQQQAS